MRLRVDKSLPNETMVAVPPRCQGNNTEYCGDYAKYKWSSLNLADKNKYACEKHKKFLKSSRGTIEEIK